MEFADKTYDPVLADSYIKIGVGLKEARLRAGITQKELAERIGTSQSYIWALENGKDITTLRVIFAALRELECKSLILIPEKTMDTDELQEDS